MLILLGSGFELVNPLKGSWEPPDHTLRTSSTLNDTTLTPIHPLDHSFYVCHQGGLLSLQSRSPSSTLPSHTLVLEYLYSLMDCKFSFTAVWPIPSTNVLCILTESMID